MPTNAHERDHRAKASQQLIDVPRAMADHAKRDVATERMLISSLSMMPSQLDDLELADPGACRAAPVRHCDEGRYRGSAGALTMAARTSR